MRTLLDTNRLLRYPLDENPEQSGCVYVQSGKVYGVTRGQ